MENETFLDVRYAKLALVCIRPECSIPVPAQNNKPPRMRDLIISLPDRCLPEEAVLIRAKHLTTHTGDI
jgi:hypothetical protein